VWLVRPGAVLASLPILLLWAFSKPVSLWLNRPPLAPRKEMSDRDRWLLRESALRTWRYFDEFSTEEHHWLIPDNVQEENSQSRASYIPDQPWLSPQRTSGGLRIRLSHRAGIRATDASNPCDNFAVAEAPRPPAQLVMTQGR